MAVAKLTPGEQTTVENTTRDTRFSGTTSVVRKPHRTPSVRRHSNSYCRCALTHHMHTLRDTARLHAHSSQHMSYFILVVETVAVLTVCAAFCRKRKKTATLNSVSIRTVRSGCRADTEAATS